MVCYYAKKKNKNLKPRKFFYGRWFVNMTELFSWILFFPFVIIFISFIACNKDVLGEINITCENNALRIIGIIFGILGLIFTIGNEWLLNLFFQNGSSVKKDAMNCEN